MGMRKLALAGAFVVLGASGAWAADSGCRVSKVTDGDTLHLSCGGQDRRVRLMGYDTPEIYHPKCAAEKRMGLEATERLKRLVASGPVTGVRVTGQDRYGRDLAYVEIAGRDVSDYMLATGLAEPYAGRKHPDWCRG